MSRRNWIGRLAAVSAVLFIGAPLHATANSRVLDLHVGSGIHAAIAMSTKTTTMRVSCSDDANCRFELPPNVAFDIVASGGSGHRFQWTGCNPLPEADRCRVQARADAAQVTVR